MSWSDEEVKILIDNKRMPILEVMKLLPGHTMSSIKNKRVKLGIAHKRKPNWSPEEDTIVLENQHLNSKEIATLIPRSPREISTRRHILGISIRPRLTEEDADLIVSLFNSNHSVSEIMSRTGKSRSSVQRILNDRTKG